MNSIKFIKNNKIKLNGTVYKPYLIGSLPPSFAFKEKWYTDNDGNDYVKEGITTAAFFDPFEPFPTL